MKNSFKFLIAVIALILGSVMLLTGCMYGITTDIGGSKPNVFDPMLSAPSINEGGPVTQAELQKKFSGMAEVDEERNSITILTEEYCEAYWANVGEKKVSLTVDEVMYIIQDSIRIYLRYDFIVLWSGEYRSTRAKTSFWSKKDQENVYMIIRNRILKLSSPEAYFTMRDALNAVGTDPDLIDALSPAELYYIPGYCENVDRSVLLHYVGSFGKEDDLSKRADFFKLDQKNFRFELETRNGVTTAYPTTNIVPSRFDRILLDSGTDTDTGAIILDGRNRFVICDRFDRLVFEDGCFGRYTFQGEDLVFHFAVAYVKYKSYQLYFEKQEDGGYCYVEERSVPYPYLAMVDGTVYYPVQRPETPVSDESANSAEAA